MQDLREWLASYAKSEHFMRIYGPATASPWVFDHMGNLTAGSGYSSTLSRNSIETHMPKVGTAASNTAAVHTCTFGIVSNQALNHFLRL
jgi:hypothetical protein